VVIAEGEVTTTLKSGERMNVLFCDVFEMENSKIKKLTSFLMNKQQEVALLSPQLI
jgi:hypothetical protein